MKYFKWELLRDENETKWQENDKIYAQFFEKFKSNLPEAFLEIYFAEYGFHDRKINKMIMSESNTLIIELVKTDKSFIKLEYKGASGLKFNNLDIMCKERQIGKYLEWGYDEFSKNGEKITHSVLTSCGFEFELSFESINAAYTDEELKTEGTALYL